jgi:hypothetical protein
MAQLRSFQGSWRRPGRPRVRGVRIDVMKGRSEPNFLRLPVAAVVGTGWLAKHAGRAANAARQLKRAQTPSRTDNAIACRSESRGVGGDHGGLAERRRILNPSHLRTT